MVQKYRKDYSAQDELDDKEIEAYDRSVRGEQDPNVEGGDPTDIDPDTQPEPDTKEEVSWKKRYGDQRRHAQKEKERLENENRELRQAKEAAEKGDIKFPATEQELQDWLERYPKLAKIFDTIVQKRLVEGKQMFSPGEDRIKELEAKIEAKETDELKRKAWADILKVHPDFEQLVDTEKFQDWISSSAKWVQDALWVNETDANVAIDAIDLYKSRHKEPTRRDTSARAAGDVTRSSSPTPTGSGKLTFTESQVAKLSPAEYERKEDEIMEAIRDGRFKYDLSAAG